MNRLSIGSPLIARLTQQTFRPRIHNQLIQKRYSGGYSSYRERTYDPNRKNFAKFAELCAGMMWWWIGWNLWHDWKHLVGEYVWPEQSSWSDEHLGIPPDDYD